jgi:DNA-binding winged helix-turn-helix (wHTH) protein/tetratricopeptide (TPR) repeat protein
LGRHYYQFGPYRLDPLARTLLRDNEAVDLTPKAAETLRVLVQHAGLVVSKETLLREVWPGTFVEEGGLTRNICDLRHALTGLDNGSPIQTIPRRGYRFVVPVCEFDGASTTGRKTLVVAPFRLLGDFDDSYIAARIADALRTRLAMLRSLNLEISVPVSGGAIQPGKYPPDHLPDVDYLLDGTLQRQNGSLRLSVHLHQAKLRSPVWADSFEEDAEDLFRLEDSLAEEIAGALSLILSSEQPKMLSHRYTEIQRAYRLYLRGRFHWHQRSEPALRRAISWFRQSLAEDPQYAPAYSALSSCYSLLPMVSALRPQEYMPKARAAAVSALEIDETLAEARAALAFINWHYDWKWKAAEREYRRIITFQPDHAISHQWYALLLVEMGHVNDALRHAAIASDLDRSPSIRANQASVLHLAGQYDDAISLARKTLSDFPQSLRARCVLALALEQKGQTAQAVRELEAASRDSGTPPMLSGALGHAYAVNGQQSAARQILNDLANLPRRRCDFGSQALVHLALGNMTRALELFEQACEEREFLLVLLGIDRRVDPLRSNPAFQSILTRIGLA